MPNIPNATATDTHFIHVHDKDAVLIRYQVTGHPQPLSLVVLGGEPEPSEPEYDQNRNYNTVTWGQGDVGYHLVSDLDEQDIRQLVPPAALVPEHGTQLPKLDARPASLSR